MPEACTCCPVRSPSAKGPKAAEPQQGGDEQEQPIGDFRAFVLATDIEMGWFQAALAAVWALPTSALAWGMVVCGVAAFITLMVGVVAPYGR